MKGRDELSTELGAYVLGALPPEEAARVRAHLDACPACAAEVARLAPLPALLALAGPEPAPREPLSPAVEEGVLDAVARERARGVAPARPRRRPPRRRVRVLLAAGGVALAALLAAVVLALPAREPSRPPGAGGYEIVLRAQAGTTGPSGRATLRRVASGTRVELAAWGLPPNDRAVYEVQCEREGWSASAGTFRADARGRAAVALTTAARGEEYDRIRVVRRARDAEGNVRRRTVLAASLS